jgi:hypothetical protein
LGGDLTTTATKTEATMATSKTSKAKAKTATKGAKAAAKKTPPKAIETAAAAAAKPAKGKRPKQLEVPGTERVQDPEIRAAAEELAEAGEALTEAHKERETAATALIEIMRKKKLKTYVDEKLKLRVDLVSGAEKVKLKRLEEKGSKAA